MGIKLDKRHNMFRNELLLYTDPKLINIDNTLVNLYMLIRWNGVKAKVRIGRRGSGETSIERLMDYFKVAEDKGHAVGIRNHSKAVEWWIRNNLINMVSRGKPDKEKFSAFQPTHLQSYLQRNPNHTRDYFSSEQVYLMLTVKPEVREELRRYLDEGWDEVKKEIIHQTDLDIDSLGMLRLVEANNKAKAADKNPFKHLQPILYKQAELFCDDIHKLLVYKSVIPRHVMIEYLKVMVAFHLALYTMKLIVHLPKMLEQGTIDVDTDFSFVVDATDNYNTGAANLAKKDTARVYDSLMDYIRCVFLFNTGLRFLKKQEFLNSKDVPAILKLLANPTEAFEIFCQIERETIFGDKNINEDDKDMLREIFDFEENDIERYIEILMKARGGFQYKYHLQLLDSTTQKNTERGILAGGGRRKNDDRRFSMGTKLLETLVQLQVLQSKANNQQFYSKAISIEGFLEGIRERYGIIIDGTREERFKNADLNTHAAFRENTEAFKNKLRQIGFYNDLSDAFILQKIKPRYTIE
jgi:hypothetical protein